MDIVILAAGMATRLNTICNNTPKYLLEVGKKTIAEYQLDILSDIDDIDKIIIVVGYKGDLIKAKLGSNYKGKSIYYIENKSYKTKDMDYSLLLAQNKIVSDSFIFLAGDVIFHKNILVRLLKASYTNCIIVDSNFQSSKVDAAIEGSNNVVSSLIAHIHGDIKDLKSDSLELIGEPLMMIKFDKNYNHRIKNAIKENMITKEYKHLMYIFAHLFSKYVVNYIDFKDLPWIEIDNIVDFQKAAETVKYL